MSQTKRSHRFRRLRLALAVGTLTGAAAAYRFALKYRERVGLPHRQPVETSPADFGLAFEPVEIPAGDHSLAAWFVPAEPQAAPAKRRRAAAKAPAEAPAQVAKSAASSAASSASAAAAPNAEPHPAIVVVHGWESNRGRTFAHVRYLHAAGFHCLVFDARGHGDNQPETLPVNVPEFADDTIAAVRWLAARPEVSAVGVVGHSMGGAGAIVAASREREIRAVVSLSAPADLIWMTRRTFEMAEMHIPDLVATPLAWFTAAVLLIPRHHSVDDASAVVAAGRYRGPLLLIHGAQDRGVPVEHLGLIERAAVTHRAAADPPVETLILPDFGHRWLYEDAGCRRKIAEFLATSLGGPVTPESAGERAAACVVERPADPVYGFGAMASKTPPSDRSIYIN
jgi:pimeloyl-ACP methyl ester carboxylesterase